MKCPRFVDDLLDRCFGWTKTKATKDAAHLSISGNINREMVRKFYLEVPC